MRNFETNMLDTMDNMFYGCSALQEIRMDNYVLFQVISMTNMFKECKSLEEVYINSENIGRVYNQMLKDINLTNKAISKESNKIVVTEVSAF